MVALMGGRCLRNVMAVARAWWAEPTLQRLEAFAHLRLRRLQFRVLRRFLVMRIQRIAAADDSVSGGGGAVAEGSAEFLGVGGSALQCVGGHVPVAEHQPPDADAVGPAI